MKINYTFFAYFFFCLNVAFSNSLIQTSEALTSSFESFLILQFMLLNVREYGQRINVHDMHVKKSHGTLSTNFAFFFFPFFFLSYEVQQVSNEWKRKTKSFCQIAKSQRDQLELELKWKLKLEASKTAWNTTELLYRSKTLQLRLNMHKVQAHTHKNKSANDLRTNALMFRCFHKIVNDNYLNVFSISSIIKITWTQSPSFFIQFWFTLHQPVAATDRLSNRKI